MFCFNVKYLHEKSISKLQSHSVKEILSTLGYLVRCNWQQIITAKLKRYHEVPLNAIIDKIANHHKLSEKKELGINSEALISIGLNNKGRLLGFRKDNEFMITYIDINHDYC